MSTQSFLKTFSNFFPLPKELSFNFVGVNLMKDSIKVVQLEDSKIGKKPVKFKDYPLTSDCGLMLSEPVYENCEELIETLKNIKKDFGVNYVNVSIPEVRTYIYKTKLPASVDNKIYDTLLYSVEENVPIKPDEILMDYFVVGVNESEVDVVVTVISEKLIKLYTKLFEEAGLRPISFEPETHAISRAIIKKGDTSESLLLNLDSKSSSITVIENEIVQYTQILPLIEMASQKDFSEEGLKNLKEEIQKVIIYWETSINNQGQNKINTLYLTGELGSSNNLLNYLNKNLSINVKFANVWSNCFKLDDYIPPIKASEALKYATSIGLSLKKIK